MVKITTRGYFKVKSDFTQGMVDPGEHGVHVWICCCLEVNWFNFDGLHCQNTLHKRKPCLLSEVAS